MVKGVNRTVIEVNDTGNEMFEKIVLYVKPKYGNLGAAQLQKALGEFHLGYNGVRPLRKRVKLRKRRVALLSVGLLTLAAVTLLIVFL